MSRSTHETVNDLAARQHGVVTRRQLVAAGVGDEAIKDQVETKRLHLMHRGVYRVGPLIAPNAREMAAVLACGCGAVVSHWSAAALWPTPRPMEADDVDITMTRRDRRRRPGIRVHRPCGLCADEVTTTHGIPVTTAARTILDLAAVVDARMVEQATARALRNGLTDRPELLSMVARHERARGARILRAVLDAHDEQALTRSEAEEQLLGMIRIARLPAPEVNVRVAGHEVDFLWRAERLVVEVDGYAFHSARDDFESDRRRDADLSARGLRVMRLTWRQLVGDRDATLARLAQALSASGVRSGRG